LYLATSIQMMKVSFSSGNADIRLKLKTSREEHCMKPRMNYYQAAPDTIKALVALEAQIQASSLENR
jgi:hypothetical protein